MVLKYIIFIFHLSLSLFIADGKFLSSLNPSELTYDGKSHFILKSFNTFYSKFPPVYPSVFRTSINLAS